MTLFVTAILYSKIINQEYRRQNMFKGDLNFYQIYMNQSQKYLQLGAVYEGLGEPLIAKFYRNAGEGFKTKAENLKLYVL